MSQPNERRVDSEKRRANDAPVPSVIEVAVDVLCHGVGEMVTAALNTAQAGGEVVCAAAAQTAQAGGEAVCAVASSAGGVIVEAAGHGVTIVGHVAAAAIESAGDALG
jgi:hypothetical protein